MPLLRRPQSLIDAFELRVLLDLGDRAVERGAVSFVLPVGHVLSRSICVSHRSPPPHAGFLHLTYPRFVSSSHIRQDLIQRLIGNRKCIVLSRPLPHAIYPPEPGRTGQNPAEPGRTRLWPITVFKPVCQP